MLRTAVTNRQVVRPYTRSLYFDGTNDEASIPITPSATGFNIGFWLKNRILTVGADGNTYPIFQSITGNARVGIKTDPSTSTLISYTRDDAGTFYYKAFDSNGNKGAFAKWTHYVFQYKAGVGTIAYRNGVAHNTDVTAVMGQMTAVITLMKQNTAFRTGWLSEICVENNTTLWTATQISDLYWRGIYPSGAKFYSLNNTNLDQNGANGITITGASYVADTPWISRTAV